MRAILANIVATGDSGKPLLVAICLIVSIVLMVVLIMIGKSNADSDEKQNIEDNRKQKNNTRSRKG
ncbi:MAG: hypothetical protein SO015_06605 [Wujia sp.]|nr:hypothetical protein [Wujia sp.]MDD7284065.1 hypothetical protein [Clostridium sp.]MDY3727805.1 hypothetical protein [Wujia sp.]